MKKYIFLVLFLLCGCSPVDIEPARQEVNIFRGLYHTGKYSDISGSYTHLRLSPHLYLATNSAQGPWWILGWSERVPGAEDVLPAPLPPYRVLTGMADRFGRTLTYRREAAGDLAGEITGVTDGAGREFRLVLTTQAQRAEEARTSSLSSSDSSRPLSASAFPDTLPGTEYGPDRGIRLSAVWLMHDPAYPESLPAAPLVRYTYKMCIRDRTSASAGPAICSRAPAPKNKPVPIAPPMAIICTWRLPIAL